MIDHLLICGSGSIGRRHMRHFRALGVGRIDVLSTGLGTINEPLPVPIQARFTDLEEALSARPQAVVVCNPTALHFDTALEVVRAGCDVLVEKPASHTLEGFDELIQEVAARKSVVSTAFNMRYHPLLKRARDLIISRSSLGEIQFARAHFGAYLPDWHPWEDYRRSYAARRDLGGGVRLTGIHEVDYLLWLMGPCEKACGIDMTKNPLGTDIEEGAVVTIRHRSGAVSVASLTFVQAPPTREVELSFTDGLVTIDLMAGTWLVRGAQGQTQDEETLQNFDIDQTFFEQARDFLRAVRREIPPPVPLEESKESLRTVLKGREW